MLIVFQEVRIQIKCKKTMTYEYDIEGNNDIWFFLNIKLI